MRTGDILKLKLSGKDRNETIYGILIDREKAGKVHLLVVRTEDKVLKLRRKSVQEVEGGKRYTGDVNDVGKVARFLKNVQIKDFGGSSKNQDRLGMTPDEIENQVDTHSLWNSVVAFAVKSENTTTISVGIPPLAEEGDHLFMEPIDGETIARIHFHPRTMSKSQISAVVKILSPCREPGQPYFTRGGHRNSYMVFTQEAMKRVEDHIHDLKDLKDIFVEWVPEPDNRRENKGKDKRDRKHGHRDKRGPKRRKVPKLRFPDPTSIELDPTMDARVSELIGWARQFMELGGWNDIPDFGLGGTSVQRVDKFSLSKYLEFFGWDLAGARILDPPSAMMEILLRMKAVTWKEASELLIMYKIASGDVDFSQSFPKRAMSEAEDLPMEPTPDDSNERMDLREHECYTIDPVDAKDFDDAVGFRTYSDPATGKKMVELRVHIADVTHYVKPGHPIDDEARKRCTSVYLPTGVLPMLPPQLSENLCSLMANVDRLAFSTRMIFDATTAELLEWDHAPSVIKVKENLSYDHVNEAIAAESNSLFARMYKFSEQLEKRYERLNIVTKERKIRFPDDGNTLQVSLKSPSPATRMIEQFMVVTNEAVARTLHESGLPSVYRIHPLPSGADVEQWNTMCDSLGYEDVRLEIDFASLHGGVSDRSKKGKKDDTPKGTDDLLSMLKSGGSLTLGGFGGSSLNEKIKENYGKPDGELESNDSDISRDGRKESAGRDDSSANDGESENAKNEEKPRRNDTLAPMDPEDLRKIITAYRTALNGISRKEESIKYLLYSRILSTLSRAVYSVNNHGHFGLNSLCYTHFTSPIRRYPDVLVHRMLKIHLDVDPLYGGSLAQGADLEDEEKDQIRDDLEIMTEVCNEQTKAAEDLERDMIDVALATRASMDAEYRSQIHECRISGLTPTSCFLSVDGAMEGRIPLSRLSKYRLTVDESKSKIILGRWENENVDPEELKNFIDQKHQTRGRIDTKSQLMQGITQSEGEQGEGGSVAAATRREEHRGTDQSESFEDGDQELYRLGETLRCAIHSIELSRGMVDLSIRD